MNLSFVSKLRSFSLSFMIRLQSPYLAIANRQAEIMMRIASEFGFTPASRSRISTPLPEDLPLFGAAEQEG
jgi:phage terminase small subunit